MQYNPKNAGTFDLNVLILDLNGTLAVKGEILEGVKERFEKLKKMGFEILLLTGDQRGNADQLCAELGIDFEKARSSGEKAEIVKRYKKENVVSVGNARIDIGTFENAAVSIATIQSEGIHTGIIGRVDILVTSILDALDLLIDKDVFEATFRK